MLQCNIMPYPYGSNQTSSLPVRQQNNASNPGSFGTPSGPVSPVADLLVATGTLPQQITVDGTQGWWLDSSPVTNRIEIAIQNAGTSDVEIFPNGGTNPTFGQGWLIKAGTYYTFNWSEAIKVYARCASGSSTDLRILQNTKQ